MIVNDNGTKPHEYKIHAQYDNIKKIILILIVLLSLGACVSIPPPEPEKEQQPKVPMVPVQSKIPDSEDELFSSAEKMFKMRAYPRALELYNKYLSMFPNGRSAPDALMREGEIHTISGDHSKARSLYKYLCDQYPASPLVPKARVEFLVTYYNERNYQQVIRQADGIIRQLNQGSPVPGYEIFRIYSLVGDSYMGAASPINAVYFYTMAQRTKKSYKSGYAAEDKNLADNLKKAVNQLTLPDIIALLERHLEDDLVNGYLMYQLGVIYNNEGRRDDAIQVLSDFIRKYPGHENTKDAKELSEKIEGTSTYNLSAVGCMLPLTGSYKIYGNKALRGIQLALNQSSQSIGGKPPINLIFKDTESDPEKAVMAVRELAKEQVSAIIGPIITSEAAAHEAQSKRIPIITLTQKEGITEIGDYVFRNFITPKMQVEAIVSYAVNNLGFSNFAVLYPDEKYGTTFMDLFQKEVLSQGKNLVATEIYRPDQTDFSASIKRLRDFQFEALFIPDVPKKVGLIIPQLAYYNLNRVQLLGTNLWHSDTLIQMAKRGANGAIIPDGFFAESHWQHVSDFVRVFKDTFGEEPEFIEAIAYDTAKMVFQILEGLDSAYGNSVKEELLNLRDYQGITGLTSFEATGEANKKIFLLRVENNRFVEVE